MREDDYKPKYTASQLLAQLEKTGNNKDRLNEFLLQWHRAIPARPMRSINRNDTVRAIYEVCRFFYRNGDWAARLNYGNAYTLVQTVIEYECTASDILDLDKYQGVFGRDTAKLLTDFRPTIDPDSSRTLYVTEKYETAFNRFLDRIPSSGSERERRYEFLRPYIRIRGTDLGALMLLRAGIAFISFNRSLTEAVVKFMVGHDHGSVLLRKTKDRWIVWKSRDW